jgi:hypothetical protein
MIGNFGVANLRKSFAHVQRPPVLFYFFLSAAAFLFTRCANPVSPQGGPKDLVPPRVLACDPPLFATGVTGSSFRIDFNEFITLKNASSEVFISPPLKIPPDSRLRGKTLLVKFDGKLDSNTTYSITFGNAITDLTEGNILKGFSYVFSTGTYIDSLSLQGTLVDAFDLKPQKNVYVELYMNNNDTLPFDSLPMRVPPYYITKTDENGFYLFHNLQNKKYKLFALADQNSDLIFNQPSEKIAFADSLVTPYYIAVKHADTSASDSSRRKQQKPLPVNAKERELAHKADSVRRADSVRESQLLYPSFPLFLFEESDSVQRLVKSSFNKEGIALFCFRFPATDVRFIPLNFDSTAPWCLREYSKRRDSVTLWISRPKTDSLILKIVSGNRVLDTVSLGLELKDNQKKSPKKASAEQLTLSNPAKAFGLNQYRSKLQLTFSYPVTRWDFSKVLLVEEKDTLHPVVTFTDSLRRTIVVDHKWKEDKNYKIIIPDSVFYGITNISHDSIKLLFKTRSERDFGNFVLTMNMDKRPGQYIIQLLNDKETTIYEEHIINQSGKIRFEYLPALKYKVKAIHDRNSNGHWDTGDYKKKIQPEEVIYFPKPVDIRANWDVEETWD